MRLERIDSLWEDPAPHKPLSLADVCEDVILLICDHLKHLRADDETPWKNLSLTNRHFYNILRPLLFRTLRINRPVSQLTPTSLPAQHARTFRLDMFGSLWWWCSGSYTSSSDAMDLFRCLQSLSNLQTLEISMMRRSIDIFCAAFSDSEPGAFTLDRIDNLVVTSSAAFLINHCPNLKSLVVQDGSDCLLETYTDLSSRLAPLHSSEIISTPPLTHFDATATWSADELLSLVHSFPQLQHLRMRSDTYCYRASTPTIISILGENLHNLKSLHLVKSGSLGMGYQSVWQRRIKACSNAEYRRMLWRENEKLRVAVENTIVRDAFGKIPSLRECWLGEKRVARSCGNADGQWMWERKSEDMEDCVMGDGAIAKLRMEKEAVVVQREMGC